MRRNNMVKIVIFTAILGTLLQAGIGFGEGLKLTASGNELCFSCHDKDDFNKKYVHFAIEGKCTICHNPHTSKYKFLLAEKVSSLCYPCHSKEKNKFTQAASVHTVVAQGECAGCHNPHASDDKFLLKGIDEKLCYLCHQQEAEEFKQGTIHLPVESGECLSCHDPHVSPFKGQLLNSLVELCFTCHDQQDEAYKNAHKQYPVGNSNCLGCHTPHASVVKGDTLADGLFLPYIHAPVGEKLCNDCHVSSDSPEPLNLIAPETEFCYICHNDIEEEVNSKASVHLPVKDGHCASCHAPHASQNEYLVAAPGEKLCAICHPDIMEKATATYEHEPVAQGLCERCHLPHTAEYESLLLKDSIALCVSCHPKQGKFTHPVGKKAIDPRTKKPMTCVSCHDAHGSEYENVLLDDGGRDLCVQCHKWPTAASQKSKVSRIH